MPNIIKCFTDASYSQHKSLSIIGYKIGEHDVVLEELLNVKNTQAELYAIKKCIKVCNEIYPDDEIIIYTDCQRAFKDDASFAILSVQPHSLSKCRDKLASYDTPGYYTLGVRCVTTHDTTDSRAISGDSWQKDSNDCTLA